MTVSDEKNSPDPTSSASGAVHMSVLCNMVAQQPQRESAAARRPQRETAAAQRERHRLERERLKATFCPGSLFYAKSCFWVDSRRNDGTAFYVEEGSFFLVVSCFPFTDNDYYGDLVEVRALCLKTGRVFGDVFNWHLIGTYLERVNTL